MSSEAAKGEREIAVFRDFIQESGIPIAPDCVQKRSPPESDILGWDTNRGWVAFELVEVCDPAMAEILDKAGRSQREESDQIGGDAPFMWTQDPSTWKKKFRMHYPKVYPLALLLYTDGRVITPDYLIVKRIRRLAAQRSHRYDEIFFLGRTLCVKVWPRKPLGQRCFRFEGGGLR